MPKSLKCVEVEVTDDNLLILMTEDQIASERLYEIEDERWVHKTKVDAIKARVVVEARRRYPILKEFDGFNRLDKDGRVFLVPFKDGDEDGA